MSGEVAGCRTPSAVLVDMKSLGRLCSSSSRHGVISGSWCDRIA